MSVLLLFLDGVGLGEEDPEHNPWVRARTPALRTLLGRPLAGRERIDRDGVLLIPTDATLGVPGLPQSATGQTALLTGLNAPALIGRHVTAYPTAALRDLLAQWSLFARLSRAGRVVTLANAYTEEYHQAVAARRLRHAAFTSAAVSAGLRLRTIDDLRERRAVFHDLTNARPRQWGYDLPALTPRACGADLARLAGFHDLTAFEFFLTDLAAHGRVPLGGVQVVEMVDDLLAGVIDALPAGVTLVIASDHGNLEDDRTPVHTLNSVPTLVIGPARPHFTKVAAITDIAPAIARALGVEFDEATDTLAAPDAAAGGAP
ncbi:MAG: metalloenzyme [Armatimonadetes bacterium]|nr:metalloenzyme [Armatimonadota bacterium]